MAVEGGVGVDEEVGVEVGCKVGVGVEVGVAAEPVTLTSSMYQPNFAVPLSDVIRKRIIAA